MPTHSSFPTAFAVIARSCTTGLFAASAGRFTLTGVTWSRARGQSSRRQRRPPSTFVYAPLVPHAILKGDGLNRVVDRAVEVTHVVSDVDGRRAGRVQGHDDVRRICSTGAVEGNRRVRKVEIPRHRRWRACSALSGSRSRSQVSRRHRPGSSADRVPVAVVRSSPRYPMTPETPDQLSLAVIRPMSVQSCENGNPDGVVSAAAANASVSTLNAPADSVSTNLRRRGNADLPIIRLPRSPRERSVRRGRRWRVSTRFSANA